METIKLLNTKIRLGDTFTLKEIHKTQPSLEYDMLEHYLYDEMLSMDDYVCIRLADIADIYTVIPLNRILENKNVQVFTDPKDRGVIMGTGGATIKRTIGNIRENYLVPEFNICIKNKENFVRKISDVTDRNVFKNNKRYDVNVIGHSGKKLNIRVINNNIFFKNKKLGEVSEILTLFNVVRILEIS